MRDAGTKEGLETIWLFGCLFILLLWELRATLTMQG